MTTRKPKPRKAAARKGSKLTLSQHVDVLTRETRERFFCLEADVTKNLSDIVRRLDALETRGHFRDASHDEPVSNAGEAIGGFRILGELPAQSRWRRFLTFMRSP